jgi:hypothetical protein
MWKNERMQMSKVTILKKDEAIVLDSGGARILD